MFGLFGKKWLIMVAGIIFVVIGMGGWWYWNRSPQLDSLARSALENAESVSSYTQEVITETDIEDRHIQVVGYYTIDDTRKQYSSRATTTLTLPDQSSHSFTLQTITLGQKLYTRIQSQSAALNLTVPSSPEWKSFDVGAIPEDYRNIVTPRPPLDNMALFKDKGSLLTIKKGRSDEEYNGEKLSHYVFGLTAKAFTETGPVGMIAERVGVHGSIDVWIRESDAAIRFLKFSNDSYTSTTEISQIGTVPAQISPL